MTNKRIHTETGTSGKVVYARIAPNEDLITSIEKICISEKISNAFIRGAVGSLTDACIYSTENSYTTIKGPAVEIVSLVGEVRQGNDGSLNASLSCIVADSEGNVYGGRFVPGMNPVCITVEVTLEEWVPDTGLSSD